MKKLTEKKAKKILKKRGYFIDCPWDTQLVSLVYNCTKKEAYKILQLALNDRSLNVPVLKAIDDAAFNFSIPLKK
jgi:hypothetical protein